MDGVIVPNRAIASEVGHFRKAFQNFNGIKFQKRASG